MSALCQKQTLRQNYWITSSSACRHQNGVKNSAHPNSGNSSLRASAILSVVVLFGEDNMLKIIAVVAALGFLFVSAPAFAQKKSCQEICLKQCEAANAKNWCMQKCVPNCNMARSKS